MRSDFGFALSLALTSCLIGTLVTVGTIDGWVQIDVSDSGPGFGSGPVGIAGLGLGIVEWLAASHGGDLSLLESSIGGTLARLRIPAARSGSVHLLGSRS